MANSAAIAIIGATGLVGRQIIASLEERQFPVSNLQLYASPRSAGEELTCGALRTRVDLLDTARFVGTDLVLIAAGEQVSAEWAGRAADNGAIVIDTSPLFVDDPEVSVVVPELNAAALVDVRDRGIVASPDSIAIAASVALLPLHHTGNIHRVVITTFEPVSGAGRAGIEELQRQTLNLMSGQSSENTVFPQRIAFNLLPHFSELLAGGHTREESATVTALRRLLDASDLEIAVTRVRVPIFYGAALSVNVELTQPMNADDVREALRAAPGLLLPEELETQSPTPADTIGEDVTCIGRVRCNENLNLIDLWVGIDNIRKGSAVNVVQIAELLLRDYL